jgi:uncharacterized protein YjiS (DUF1127 family)
MVLQSIAVQGEKPAFSAIVRLAKDMVRRRSQRLALSELLTMEPHRLDDLGIDLGDILEAIRCPPRDGKVLEQRRAAHADERVGS